MRLFFYLSSINMHLQCSFFEKGAKQAQEILWQVKLIELVHEPISPNCIKGSLTVQKYCVGALLILESIVNLLCQSNNVFLS